jgi:hypothetical protein
MVFKIDLVHITRTDKQTLVGFSHKSSSLELVVLLTCWSIWKDCHTGI